jgi:RHH-type proline utilization regulon transcriptional repressor/proline dehydrogenase/delta 1-pyrroline-5-carboxylate dehydrogenase
MEHVFFIEQSDEECAADIDAGTFGRVRYAHQSRVPEVVRRTVPKTGVHIADTPVLREGRIELLWYLREQSVCIDYHRYGNLGRRSDEPRSEPD